MVVNFGEIKREMVGVVVKEVEDKLEVLVELEDSKKMEEVLEGLEGLVGEEDMEEVVGVDQVVLLQGCMGPTLSP